MVAVVVVVVVLRPPSVVVVVRGVSSFVGLVVGSGGLSCSMWPLRPLWWSGGGVGGCGLCVRPPVLCDGVRLVATCGGRPDVRGGADRVGASWLFSVALCGSCGRCLRRGVLSVLSSSDGLVMGL